MDALVARASKVLAQRTRLEARFEDPNALMDILRVGTSAGEARAKAVIAWDPKTKEVRSGQGKARAGFEYWLLKFDGVAGNKEKELGDPQGDGTIEYAYFLMARDAGIVMSECRLLEESGRRHFMTMRFDRLESGEKLHMLSLSALAHFDFNFNFNNADGYGYEQAMLIMRRLGLQTDAVEQMFRRMVFNILARNQDDHVKNIGFLMDKRGFWSLAPAFDIMYSYNPEGLWTSNHQMTLNRKRDGFNMADFKAGAEAASLKRGRAEAIVTEVGSVIRRWPEYAEMAKVSEVWTKQIETNLRREIMSR